MIDMFMLYFYAMIFPFAIFIFIQNKKDEAKRKTRLSKRPKYTLTNNGIVYDCAIDIVKNNCKILNTGGGVYADWWFDVKTLIVTKIRYNGKTSTCISESNKELSSIYDYEKILDISKQDTLKQIRDDMRTWHITYDLCD